MMMRVYLFFLGCLLLAGIADAAPVDPGSSQAVVSGWQTFFTNAQASVTRVLNDSEYVGFVNILFTFFAVLLIIFFFTRYAMGEAGFYQALLVIFLLSFVRLLLNEYPTLTNAIWNWGQGFGGLIQRVLLGSTDLWAPLSYVQKMTSALLFNANYSWWDIPSVLMSLLASVLLAIIAFMLVIIVSFATAWGMWGFLVAKMLGQMFLPFLLFERLSFLFDGWLKFFLSFVFYAVIARINVALVALAFSAYFGVPPSNIGDTAFDLTGKLLSELWGLAFFQFVGIVALISTGRFVMALVGGANITMGSALHTAAGFAAGGVTRAVRAVKGA